MNDLKTVSDEKLNAFIDDQLDADERAEVLSAIQSDKSLEEKFNRLMQAKEMVMLAYDEVPYPRETRAVAIRPPIQYWKLSIAASLLMIVGVALGWMFGGGFGHNSSESFLTVSQLQANEVASRKVLVHVSTMDEERVEQALNKAEELLVMYRKNNIPLDLEIVANAKGLGVLRDNSPYAERVKTLVDNYENVSFLACGIAKENARMKEGRDVELLPQATQIPAALDQILKRIKLGWLYVRA